MANWYGIPGIEFHFTNAWADPQITYDGIRDSINVDVECALWDEYCEECNELGIEPDMYDGLEDYMLRNAETVKDCIVMFREAV